MEWPPPRVTSEPSASRPSAPCPAASHGLGARRIEGVRIRIVILRPSARWELWKPCYGLSLATEALVDGGRK